MPPSVDEQTQAEEIDASRAAKLRLAQALEEKARRQAERKLHSFIKQSWSNVEPQRPFKDNWHIGFVCEHLEAVKMGQIKDLLINQPPATMKSLTVSVFFTAWLWCTVPGFRFLCVSFDQTLSTRDNLRMRGLVESQWYQERWPDTQLSKEQNQKTRFDTTAGGWRIGTSIGGRIIGEHPNGKIVDDPHNPKKQLLSEVEIKAATDFWDYGLSVRGATLGAWTILLMQRLHEKDLSGHALANRKEGMVHLCLPMRYEPKRMVLFREDLSDPRTEPGQLLWPEEWDEKKVRTAEIQFGSWGTAGQFQQRPAPAGGLMFKRDWFPIVHALPKITKWVRFWDVAGTEGGSGPQTAGTRMGVTADGQYVIYDVTAGRWSDAGVDRNMRQTAEIDGHDVLVREEQEPGSAGKAVVRARVRKMAGFDYRGIRPDADKVSRARPMRAQAEVGNVMLYVPTTADIHAPMPAWIKEFLDEIEVFPAGALKDRVDSATGAFNVLTGVSEDLDITTGEPAPDSELSAEELAAREAEKAAAAAKVVEDSIEDTGFYWPTGGSMGGGIGR